MSEPREPLKLVLVGDRGKYNDSDPLGQLSSMQRGRIAEAIGQSMTRTETDKCRRETKLSIKRAIEIRQQQHTMEVKERIQKTLKSIHINRLGKMKEVRVSPDSHISDIAKLLECDVSELSCRAYTSSINMYFYNGKSKSKMKRALTSTLNSRGIININSPNGVVFNSITIDVSTEDIK